MRLALVRFQFDKDWTLGRLFENGIQTGFVVEDEVRNVKHFGETAIPVGTYKLGLRFSPRFSHKFYWSDTYKNLIHYQDYNRLAKAEKAKYSAHKLIEVLDVPQFKYILIHWGNTDLDTDGCLIIGDKLGVINGRNGVLNSRNFYAQFYARVYPILNTPTGSINSYLEIKNAI